MLIFSQKLNKILKFTTVLKTVCVAKRIALLGQTNSCALHSISNLNIAIIFYIVLKGIHGTKTHICYPLYAW